MAGPKQRSRQFSLKRPNPEAEDQQPREKAAAFQCPQSILTMAHEHSKKFGLAPNWLEKKLQQDEAADEAHILPRKRARASAPSPPPPGNYDKSQALLEEVLRSKILERVASTKALQSRGPATSDGSATESSQIPKDEVRRRERHNKPTAGGPQPKSRWRPGDKAYPAVVTPKRSPFLGWSSDEDEEDDSSVTSGTQADSNSKEKSSDGKNPVYIKPEGAVVKDSVVRTLFKAAKLERQGKCPSSPSDAAAKQPGNDPFCDEDVPREKYAYDGGAATPDYGDHPSDNDDLYRLTPPVGGLIKYGKAYGSDRDNDLRRR